eukprot:4984415-Prymnesium_polylepis.2
MCCQVDKVAVTHRIDDCPLCGIHPLEKRYIAAAGQEVVNRHGFLPGVGQLLGPAVEGRVTDN